MASLVGATPAFAGTTFVPNRFDDPGVIGNNCAPPAPANGCSLRGAVASAGDGDTVQLGTGTYTLSHGALGSVHAITISGAGASATTIAQASTNANVITATGSSIALSKLTLTGGNLVGTNGANGTANLSSSSAAAVGGTGQSVSGAALLFTGAATLTDVIVTGNMARGGDGGKGASAIAGVGGAGGSGGAGTGAIAGGTSPLTLVRSAVVHNVLTGGHGGKGAAGIGGSGAGADGGAGGPEFGGAITESGTTSMTDSLIADNTVQAGPGGDGGDASNASNLGGGAGGAGGPGSGAAMFDFNGGPLDLTNVTITGNVVVDGPGGTGGSGLGLGAAGGKGGHSDGGNAGLALSLDIHARLDGVTITGNDVGVPAPGAGGTAGLGGQPGTLGDVFTAVASDLVMGASSDATLELRDTILAGGPHAASNCINGGQGLPQGTITSDGHNLDDANTCIPSPAAGDLVNTPAGLGVLADNGGPTQTMALAPGSAAVGAGGMCVQLDGVTPLTADQRGQPRADPCDIGAFESTPPSPAPPPPAPPSPPPPTPTTIPTPTTTPITPAASPIVETQCTTCGLLAPLDLTKLRLGAASVHRGHGIKLTFTLNRAGHVTFRLRREETGVKVKRICVAPSRQRHGAVCTRRVGAIGAPHAVDGKSGANSVRWTPPRTLGVGRYVVEATAQGGRASDVGVTIGR